MRAEIESLYLSQCRLLQRLGPMCGVAHHRLISSQAKPLSTVNNVVD